MGQHTALSPFHPRRALISVSDKSGIYELAHALHQHGVELIATGNTALYLKEKRLPITEVSECTGFAEMMDGRVKTLHPAIHAGLLARKGHDEDILEHHGIQPIDLLIVNFYPFENIISNPDCDFHKAIENIDIGGPAMVRSAAKNYANTSVIVTPKDYAALTEYLIKKEAPSYWNFSLAKKAFVQIAAYDAAIANYLTTLDNDQTPCGFPDVLTCQFHKSTDLRYGENPHQQAIFYTDKNAASGSLGTAQLLQGKALSFNNILDADAALDCIKSFPIEKPVCVIVKHANPCGIAVGTTICDAYLKAFHSDPISAYGGIIAFNKPLDEKTTQALLKNQFVEVIIAPDIQESAKKILTAKKTIRVLNTGTWPQDNAFKLNMRTVDGGLLVQEHDLPSLYNYSLKTVTQKEPTEAELKDLIFSWIAAKHVKSNAIVFAKSHATLGIGGGQTSRVMSARIGIWQAEERGFNLKGAVMASDAFIPFADTVEIAVTAGISAIIQPGGSIRDEEIIACANAHNVAMVFTAYRHFKH